MRQPINTTTGAVNLLAAAAKGDLQPPALISVPAGALPFWQAIIRARPREGQGQSSPAMPSRTARPVTHRFLISALIIIQVERDFP